ncbi:hypothetical protein Nmel_001016, partial [Mimus melanotis]
MLKEVGRCFLVGLILVFVGFFFLVVVWFFCLFVFFGW